MNGGVRELIEEALRTSGEHHVAGAVVGVDVAGERLELAHGTANLNTGQPFTEDTGFLLGSVTKILTTTILMRLVERGLVDLDAPAARYVPEFALRDADAAAEITVRMLVNHTNGIDADLLMPSGVRGRDALKSYTSWLPRFGVLFEPGTCIHYTNPGFVLAGRVIEEQIGLPFERAMEVELFEPCGMEDATAVQTQAFLRRTAVGAFADADGELRATSLFTLPEAAAAAGSTPIVTVADLLAFGRMHLNGGTAPNRGRLLARESVEAMQATTFNLGIPQAPPIGLGWWRVPVAGTVALFHAGGSPGGGSIFYVLPEHDAVVASFSTGRSKTFDDALHIPLIEELTARPVESPLEIAPTRPDDAVLGEYRSSQNHTRVERHEDGLAVTTTLEPLDEDHQRTLGAYGFGVTTVVYESVAPGQFAPVGTERSSLRGLLSRSGLLATLPPAPGRRAGLHRILRYTPKV